MPAHSRDDERFIAAAIRLSRRNSGRTGTNPSVATLVVRDGTIIGRGITALGGRPHAEAAALAEAGEGARGATAYVTLEPCAHHGRTPPCAEALIAAGIARVVSAYTDPDPRVSGRGYGMLRQAGVEVVEGIMAAEAADAIAGYLIRSVSKRPEVILKLALSADGMIGRTGQGQIAITGAVARGRVHLMRAEVHAVIVGGGTARADDPELTCRLSGLEDRSPMRIVVGGAGSVALSSQLAQSAGEVPVSLAAGDGAADDPHAAALAKAGVRLLATEKVDGRVALPELMEDLAGQGVMSVLVEGGAELARSFLAEDLVDRIVLFEAQREIGPDGIPSPLTADTVPDGFVLARDETLGEDRCREWVRKDRF